MRSVRQKPKAPRRSVASGRPADWFSNLASRAARPGAYRLLRGLFQRHHFLSEEPHDDPEYHDTQGQ